MKKNLLESGAKDEVAQWLTRVPENSTPLQEAVDAAREVAYAVSILVISMDLDDLRESLRTVVSAMHVSAGLKCPDDIDLGETPAETDVERAFEALSCVETEGLLECLSQSFQEAMDVINEWRNRCEPDDADSGSND